MVSYLTKESTVAQIITAKETSRVLTRKAKGTACASKSDVYIPSSRQEDARQRYDVPHDCPVRQSTGAKGMRPSDHFGG